MSKFCSEPFTQTANRLDGPGPCTCCTPSVDVFHQWKFVLSVDERAHSSTHPIRLVERIYFKFHETELIPWMILSIHRLYYPTGGDLQNCATCATNLQRCIMTFASH